MREKGAHDPVRAGDAGKENAEGEGEGEADGGEEEHGRDDDGGGGDGGAGDRGFLADAEHGGPHGPPALSAA